MTFRAFSARLTALTVLIASLSVSFQTNASAWALSDHASPEEMDAAYVIFDRKAGQVVAERTPARQFRSASIVKLLIAFDLLWDRGPTFEPTPADKPLLESMLRSSDDDAASNFWVQLGRGSVVSRMKSRLHLKDTNAPEDPGMWGYTATSARDTVQIYRYLLDEAKPRLRTELLGHLRQSTRCGTDGFEQTFGIPAAFTQPWAVKQGWSGFGGSTSCPKARQAHPPGRGDVDLKREALHTSGVVGAEDRSIVAIFSLHKKGTTFARAYTDLTNLTRSLTVPGATLAPRPPGHRFSTWGKGVRVRIDTTTDSSVVDTIPSQGDVMVKCQKRGERVTIGDVSNDWWSYLYRHEGYMSNVYFREDAARLPGVPDC